jgi:hypothetical protein
MPPMWLARSSEAVGLGDGRYGVVYYSNADGLRNLQELPCGGQCCQARIIGFVEGNACWLAFDRGSKCSWVCVERSWWGKP